jgi:hypothetical protein
VIFEGVNKKFFSISFLPSHEDETQILTQGCYIRYTSFGKRIGGAARRHNECLILEPSEMIVIDYVDGRARTERITDSSTSSAAATRGNGNHHDSNRDGASSVSSDCISEVTIFHRIGLHQQQDILESGEMGSFVDSSDGGASTNSPESTNDPISPDSKISCC